MQLQNAPVSQSSRNGKISVKLVPKNFTKNDSQMTSLNLELLNKKPQTVIKKNPARSPYSSKSSSRLVSHLALQHALSQVESGARSRLAPGNKNNTIAASPDRVSQEAARTRVGTWLQYDRGGKYDLSQSQSRYILRQMNGPMQRVASHADLAGPRDAADAYGDNSEFMKIQNQRESRSNDQHSPDS